LDKNHDELLIELQALQRALQAEKLRSFRRRVAIGDLITDRWENAREYGFGEGTSCYDNVLVLGNVTVGQHTWIGPNVILDGSGLGLSIGSHCSISAGVQIYTHHTVRRTVTGGQEPVGCARTVIGDGVYIGPNSVVAMGVLIGDSTVIGALSFVNSDIPSQKYAWGSPARIVGDVEL
jgi:acetyltransferase-like isoleucine patch superfamily enzyme